MAVVQPVWKNFFQVGTADLNFLFECRKSENDDVHRLFPVESWQAVRYQVTMMLKMRHSCK
jgi:hypothetical protein